MSSHAWILLGVFLAVLLPTAKPLGIHIANVMEGRCRVAGRFEAALYRACGIRPAEEMSWLRYASALLLFNLLGVLSVYAVQRLQAELPLNPLALPDVRPDTAFNTAISFATNTNWQAYGGESTLSHLSQMLALCVQNFLSAATGIVVAIALIRGFARQRATTLGNAWVDLTRIILYVLLPLAFVEAIFLNSQGVVQNFVGQHEVTTLQGSRSGRPLDLGQTAEATPNTPPDAAATRAAGTSAQRLAMGPLATQEAIKLLGSNGGGFMQANSAHPYANPTPLTNFVQMLSIFLIPAALCLTFGRMVGDLRQGWTLLAAMGLIFVILAIAAMHFEAQANPLLTRLGVDPVGGNMEGKELRFGIADSALFATISTLAACGAVNAMHDSFTPLGGMILLIDMQLGEVVFGGVGSGLYGMLLFAILAVFVAGLMIGRTPEYLGKKIEAREMWMSSIAVVLTPLLVLGGTAIAVLLAAGRAGIGNPGAHGFSEILYAFTSAANNNGSAFAGLSANTPFYNLTLAAVMLFGRCGVIGPVLAIAGSLAAKQRLAAGAGTLPTQGPLFVALLSATVLLVGLLNYVPALALGPLAEHLLLRAAE